jgi:hypothetical protein
MTAIVNALGITGTPVSELTGGAESSLFELFEAVKANKASVELNNDGVLTAALSKSSVRAIRRAEKAERLDGIKSDITAALEAQRPQKIGPIVSELAKARAIVDDGEKKKFRGEVLEALRALREDGVVTTNNATASNFHATHTLTSKPEAFPVVEETEVSEAEAASEVSEGEGSTAAAA